MILTVDDSPFERTVMRAILEEAGYTVREAQSGLEALELVQTSAPQLIITDVVMPDVDGFELTRRLRAQNLATPVAMVSGLEDPQVILQGLQAGANGFLPKPYTHEELKALVGSFLEPGAPPVHAGSAQLFALLRSSVERQVQLQRQVEDCDRRQRRTLAVLAALDQELRTPLEGLSSWLQQRAATDALAELAQRRAERLLARLDDLREMRRLEAGEVSFEKVPVRVGDALLQAVEAARLRGLKVRSAPLAEGLAVQGDPGRLLQALVLVLTEAGQAGPVSVRAYPSGSTVVFEVRVRENAPPGQSAHLTLARQLVELQRGTFSEDRTPEKGTTWRFNLPQP